MEIKTTREIFMTHDCSEKHGFDKWVLLEDIFNEVSECQKERVSEADILWNLLVKLRNGGK